MKVDLTPRSGWPYAGPWLTNEYTGQMLESQHDFARRPRQTNRSFSNGSTVVAVTMRRNVIEAAQLVTNWQTGFAQPPVFCWARQRNRRDSSIWPAYSLSSHGPA